MFKKLSFVLLCSLVFVGVHAQQVQKQSNSNATSKPISTKKWVALIDSIETLKLENEVLAFEKQQLLRKLDSAVTYQTALNKYTHLRTQLEIGNQTNFNNYPARFITEAAGQTTLILYEAETEYSICLKLFDTNSVEVKTLYPKLYKQLIAQTISFQFQPPSVTAQMLKVPDLQTFLRKTEATKKAQKEQASADECLAHIKQLNELGYFYENVYTNYLEMEKRKFTNPKLSDLIDMRTKYIIYLHKQIDNGKK